MASEIELSKRPNSFGRIVARLRSDGDIGEYAEAAEEAAKSAEARSVRLSARWS